MNTAEEARMCINIHLRCSVSFQPSRISTYLLQQIQQLLFKQYGRVEPVSCSPANGRSPASTASFPLYRSICQSMLPCRDKQSGSSAAGQGGERFRLRNPFLGLCCSAQNLCGKGRWPGQWWNQRYLLCHSQQENGTGRLEETVQRQ